jgi:hypothetical protein
MSFCLAHSGQMMSSASVMKPLPTSEVLQEAQMKQSLCQWRSSNEMNLVPPIPVIGFTHEVHLLANNSPKQSPQNGFSSLDVKRCPASDVLQWLHVKHSLCQGSFLYVTPPLVIILSHLTQRVENFSS